MAALSYTRFAEIGEIEEFGAGYIFFLGGPKSEERLKQKQALSSTQTMSESYQDFQKASITTQ